MPELSDRLRAVVDALPLHRGIRVIAQALAGSRAEIEAGVLSFPRARVEDFVLEQDEAPFDLAFAVRVGALDGRHPEAGRRALARPRAALAPDGRLLVDGGDPLHEVSL
jgi:hypothetical protein